MSIHAVSWALRQELPPVPKFVLVALCERANSDTGQCWPGVESLAKAVSLSPRSVVTYIGALVRNGYVMRQPMRGKDGRKRNNHYWVCFDRQPAEWIGPTTHAEIIPVENDEAESVASLPQADFAHGSSSVEKPSHHAQTDSPGPYATVCIPQETLAEPEYFQPSVTVPVEGYAIPPATPPGFAPTVRIKQAEALRAAEAANRGKPVFVFEGTEAWKAWQKARAPRGTPVTTRESDRQRGWWFPTLFPPKCTGPPLNELQASLDDLDHLAKEMD